MAVPAKATIKIADENQCVVETPSRDTLWEIQTPQVVKYDWLLEGFAYCEKHQITVTDDVSLAELLGKPVKLVNGDYRNIKVTTPEDFVTVKQLTHAQL